MSDRVLLETRYLRFVDRDGWYFVERPGVMGVVAIVAVTDDGRLLLVEQRRAPIQGRTIELPAGLVGDEPGSESEGLADAARRELVEETGWDAAGMELLARLPTSPGMTSEVTAFFRATGLRKVGDGGGVGDEQIRVHEVPVGEVRPWLRAREAEGLAVAATVYAGLALLGGRVPVTGT